MYNTEGIASVWQLESSVSLYWVENNNELKKNNVLFQILYLKGFQCYSFKKVGERGLPESGLLDKISIYKVQTCKIKRTLKMYSLSQVICLEILEVSIFL